MREINSEYVRQKKGEPHRRWFADEYFDLLVWEDETGEIVGFELSYDKNRDQRALTWEKQKGYHHFKVDDGESRPGKFKGVNAQRDGAGR